MHLCLGTSGATSVGMTPERRRIKVADETVERGQLVPALLENRIGLKGSRQPYRWLLQDSVVQPKSPVTKKTFKWTQLVERTLVRSPRENGT